MFLVSFLETAGVICSVAIRDLRKAHDNLVMGIIFNVAQNAAMLAVFFAISHLMGSMARSVRGDLLVYLMTGIFLYMIHVKTITAVMAADGVHQGAGKISMTHPLINITAAALSSLYIQVTSAALMLFVYHAFVAEITISSWSAVCAFALMAWVFGIGIGCIMIFLRALHPGAVGLASQVYMRISMVTSGAMFVANVLPVYILGWMTWNPMFHLIDAARGAAFINYETRHSDLGLAALCIVVTVLIGVVLQDHTRRTVSASRFAS